MRSSHHFELFPVSPYAISDKDLSLTLRTLEEPLKPRRDSIFSLQQAFKESTFRLIAFKSAQTDLCIDQCFLFYFWFNARWCQQRYA